MNASYEPIKIIHWQKAILLWLQERVEVLDFHSTQVRSISQEFPLPAVIKLKKYINLHGNKGVRLTRQNIFLRDGYQCQYCQSYFHKKNLTVDHVHPISKGGKHCWNNVVTACNKCNNRKGSKTLQEFGKTPLNLPEEPHWLPQSDLKYKSKKIPESWRQYLDFTELGW
ncbi:MAG: HNH endonuclease [Bdellovibrionaceae bacterium]|nr:HNH endonuclease [Pseudobdellovibrionaceae bacterium]